MGYIVNNRVDTGGIPLYLIKKLLENNNIPTLIETGSAGGESAKKAASHFKRVHTIELIEGRLEKDGLPPNITWHQGNSIDVLPELMKALLTKKFELQKDGQDTKFNYAMFFLDAHYSDPTPNTSPFKECYLLEELEIISPYSSDAIVLIDDLRLFCGHPPAPNNPKDWPSIQQIFAVFNEKYHDHYTTIVDDYILSVPNRLRESVDEEWRQNYHIRYPKAEDKLKFEAKRVWDAVKSYLE